jgi:threonine dehydrogenase-like Zn-dependent dehydrogenase
LAPVIDEQKCALVVFNHLLHQQNGASAQSNAMYRLLVTAPRQAEFEAIPEPVYAATDLLVRARVTAISTGTELRVFRLIPVDDGGQFLHANVPFAVPTENGYSMVGDVIAVGADVTDFAVGDRVFVPATHRHVAAIAANLAIKLPPKLADEEAVFLSILEVAHLALRRGNPTPGETVAIIGLGVIGLSALAYCRAFGFHTIAIDTVLARRAIAQEMGADLVISPEDANFHQRVFAETNGYGVDLVIEAASVWPAIQLGMEIAGKGAKIVVVARHTDKPAFSPVGDPFLQKDLTLLVTYGHPSAGQRWERSRSFGLTIRLLANRQLKIAPMITHRQSWRDLPIIYQRIDQGERTIVGVVLNWQE